MIDNATWAELKQIFSEVFSWAQNTILFNLTINDVSIRLSIFDFAVALVAFDLIMGVVWAVFNRGGSDD